MYLGAFAQGDHVSPVVVQWDGEVYWLRDGFHRIAAAKAVGLESIEAEIIEGTYADMEAEWSEAMRAGLDGLREWAKNRAVE